MENDLPKRKAIRLQGYDYAGAGYYFITVCTHDKLPILSKVSVGQGLAPADIKATPIGIIVEKQLLDLPNRFYGVSVIKHVLMPTHLHAIIGIGNVSVKTVGASPHPTLIDVVRVFKSMSTRLCNQLDNVINRKIWQSSFHDHVIRNEADYLRIWQYIDENPMRWHDDCYFVSDM